MYVYVLEVWVLNNKYTYIGVASSCFSFGKNSNLEKEKVVGYNKRRHVAALHIKQDRTNVKARNGYDLC